MTSFSASADDIVYQYAQQNANNMQDLVKYLTNLGQYFGYDITQPGVRPPQTPNHDLLNATFIELTENYAINSFLGAIPVDYISKSLAQFIPSHIKGAAAINNWANYTFANYGTSSSGQNGSVSASALIDQPANQGSYLQDPVSQAVFNILGTPDYTYCMDNGASNWLTNCPYMFQYKVMTNVIGSLPQMDQYFTYDYNAPLISQLNSNSLLGPLLYSTEGQSSGTGSATTSTQNAGLTAQNQAQQAANFIRYASGAVTPTSLPKQSDYSTLYSQAFPPKNLPTKVDPIAQENARAVLGTYFNDLRTYAAQSSVGVGNLYYLLSKRLPQSQSGDNSLTTSQALSEFTMATWRLFNTNPNDSNNQKPNKAWVEQLGNASSATVQKEIAVLLAEINYQMYLDRQLQERLLLTNSIALLKNLKSAQPSADFSNQNAPGNQ